MYESDTFVKGWQAIQIPMPPEVILFNSTCTLNINEPQTICPDMW